MNRIFKVKWNSYLQTFIVCSELAKTHFSISSSSKPKRKKIAAYSDKSKVFTLSALLLGLFSLNNAMAYKINDDGTTNNNSTSVAIGSSKANPASAVEKSIAIGPNAEAHNLNSGGMARGAVAIGKGALTRVSGAIAIGDGAYSHGDSAVAIGVDANTTGVYTMAIGTKATSLNGQAIGAKSNAGYYAVAVGLEANASGTHSVAVGKAAKAEDHYSIAMGWDALSNSMNSLALGVLSKATNKGAIAIGRDSKSGGSAAMALGYASEASGDGSIAQGYFAKAMGSSSVALSSNANASGQHSVALGSGANALAYNSYAIGVNTKSLAGSSLAVGTNANASASNALALGTNTNASADSALALSTSANANGTRSVALGYNTKASESQAVAIGVGANASANDALAFGTNANATIGSSVALGTNSVTTDTLTQASAGTTSYASGQVSNITYKSFAGAKPISVLSVGNVGKERRIQNVAAGLIAEKSTDAINGSQLYFTQNALGNVGNSVVTNLGGNAKMNQDGNITFTNIGGTGKDTIHEAIQFATTAVKSGKNTKVDQTPNKNEYTVNAWDTTVSAQNNGGLTLTPAIDDTNMTRAYALSINTDNKTIQINKEGKLEVINSNDAVVQPENYFHVNTGDATQSAGDATTNKGTVDAKGGASAKNALAAGVNAKAKGENAIAIGLDSTAEKLSSIAIGKKSNAVGSESVAVGLEAKSDGWRTVAIGYQAETTVESANAIGNQAKATNWGATALGTIAKAVGTNSSALGNNAHANGAFGTAVGTSSVASGAYSTALGTLSNAVAYGTIGTGLHSYAGKKDAIATGSYSVASGLSSIATGAKAGAYGNLSMAMGSDAKADDDQSIAVGANSRAISAYSMAMGSNALTMAEGALALGHDAFVGSSLELEEATLDYFTKLDEYYSNERVLAHTSPSASTYNDLKAKSTTLAAELAVLKEKYTQAASASETENAVAIGAYSQAMHKEALALGSYSTTEAPLAAIPATVNGITYSDFAGNNPLATVSVGSKDKERKIINVAAGRIAKDSTDAINGSQLYLTQHALGNVGNSVVTNFGGNAKMNQDGNITFTNIGGTGKNTIHEAIQFATTAVKSGKNTKVDQTPNKNEYTVNAWDTTVSAQNNSGLTLTPTIDVTNMTRAYALSINTDNETIKVENGTLVVKKEAIDSNTITEVAQGDNIVVSGGNEVNGKRVYTVAVAKDVDLNTIKVNKALNVGNVTINQAGINAGNQKVTGVADGDISAQSKDAVNGSQLHKVINDFNTNVAASKTEVKAGTNVTSVTSTAGGNGQSVYTVNADGASVSAGSDAITVAKGVKDANNVTNYSVDLAEKTKADVQKGVDAHTTVTNKGLTFAGDSGSTEAKKLGSTVKVKGDRNITTLASSDTVNVKLNEDISVKSVKAGNTLVNNDGVTVHNKATGKSVRLTSNGLNNGGHRVTHIADGREDTDAVNVRQLKQVDNNVRHLDAKVNRVDHKLRAGIAQAGAMANIPQVTRSGASGVGVGVANYRGESAVSVGYSRLSDNGKHIIKGSVSVDSSGFGMAGAGYMYQW
ncbi:Hep_Hag family protein [Mannheimia sp. USDA-ARS-USMARC-1261]|uniref:YadA-like family protein n=1 Tax=Mannheimia sp. USDA-ARS-USMARC-1261 TaxID=1432056 RepID=UPI0003E3B511|nr:YadA-like family protein [Mannheimia sp. USDA-ARS-USMARC-1261]AHG73511.1 Hep_Hag family protein [Mannheimia sp. USDA-ARS-USMARC-1261]